MMRWLNNKDAVTGIVWYVLLGIALPVITLLGAGLIYLWQQGYLIPALLAWLCSTLLAYGTLLMLRTRVAKDTDRSGQLPSIDDSTPLKSYPGEQLPNGLSARSDWSEQDCAIWETTCQTIEESLKSAPEWDQLPTIATQQLASIAEQYHGASNNTIYRFTLPEALLVLSVASERYRQLILDTVPYADQIQVGSVLSLYQQKQTLTNSYVWINRIRRIVRLANPVGAAIGELREFVTNKVLTQASGAVQTSLKRLLLQEIAQAGIDLYSGKLKVSDSQLADFRSQAARDDKSNVAVPVEPLRVVLLGQINAGKSSLINALVNEVAAETDILPTTDRSTVHRLSITDGTLLHIIDTPGIGTSENDHSELVDTAANADLLIWLTRANQPARAADHDVYQQIQEYFKRHANRRKPPLLLVMTHADNLPPAYEWDPPYAADGTAGKASIIQEALVSIRDQIKFPADIPMIPVCLSPDRGLYNVDKIIANIDALTAEATQAQFNRRRVDMGNAPAKWSTRKRQLTNLARAAGRSIKQFTGFRR